MKDEVFKIAIDAARKVHREAGDLRGELRVPVTGPINQTTPVHVLAWAIKKIKLPIEIRRTEVQGEEVNAFIARYEKACFIWVSLQANHCYKRYYICKELIHVLTFEDGNRFADYTSDQVTRLIRGLLSKGLKVGESYSDSIKMEYAAYLGAIELLMPTYRMPEYIEYIEAVKDYAENELKIRDFNPYAELAKRIEVPEFIVTARMEPSPSLGDLFSS